MKKRRIRFYSYYEFYVLIVFIIALGFTVTVANLDKSGDDFDFQPFSSVQIDGLPSTGTTKGNTITISHTTTNTESNRYMLVGISLVNEDLDFVKGIEYNGNPMTKVGEVYELEGAGAPPDDNSGTRNEIWELRDVDLPNDGNPHDVVIEFTEDGITLADVEYGAVAGVLTFYNVDQIKPLETQDGDSWPNFAENWEIGVYERDVLHVDSNVGNLAFGMESSRFREPVITSGQAVQWILSTNGIGNVNAQASTRVSDSLTERFQWSLITISSNAGVSIRPSGAGDRITTPIVEVAGLPKTWTYDLFNDGNIFSEQFIKLDSDANFFVLSVGMENLNDEKVSETNLPTFGSVPFTKIGHNDQDGTESRIELFYLANPASGLNNLEIEFDGIANAGTDIVIGIVPFKNVDTSLPQSTAIEEITGGIEVDSSGPLINTRNGNFVQSAGAGLPSTVSTGQNEIISAPDQTIFSSILCINCGELHSFPPYPHNYDSILWDKVTMGDAIASSAIHSGGISPYKVSWIRDLGISMGVISLKPVSTSIVSSCDDTDGGVNLFELGTATLRDRNGNVIGAYTDSCGDSQTLLEARCFGDSGAGKLSESCDNGCLNGVCIQSAAPACGDGNLDMGEECDDGNLISGDGCSATCTSEVCSIDSDCNDNLFCNGVEFCNTQFECQSGVPIAVDDGVSCTTDSCDEVNDLVIHIPDHSVCQDGLFCNGVESCDILLNCVSAVSVISCDDGLTCTTDMCNEGVIFIDDVGYCSNLEIDNDGDGFSICPSLSFDCNDADPNTNINAFEICDLVDNDCDGTIDEGCACLTGETRNCGTNNVGSCTLGSQACLNNFWGECVGNIEPVAEICDALDNDCDGIVDNELTPDLCALQLGVCENSLSYCSGALGWLECIEIDYGSDYEIEEFSCGDGMDNDCDGLIDCDEDFCLGSGYCFVPGIVGICGDGILDIGEECDDRNLYSGDGCSAFCEIEFGYNCDVNFQPSNCVNSDFEYDDGSKDPVFPYREIQDPNVENPRIVDYKIVDTISDAFQETKMGKIIYWAITVFFIIGIIFIIWRLVKKFRRSKFKKI